MLVPSNGRFDDSDPFEISLYRKISKITIGLTIRDDKSFYLRIILPKCISTTSREKAAHCRICQRKNGDVGGCGRDSTRVSSEKRKPAQGEETKRSSIVNATTNTCELMDDEARLLFLFLFFFSQSAQTPRPAATRRDGSRLYARFFPQILLFPLASAPRSFRRTRRHDA